MKIWAVEGNKQYLDGGSMFGHVPKALWETWLTPDSDNRIPLACRALLIQTEQGRNILFETGIGAFFEPKLKKRYGVVENEHMLLKNLEKIGLSHSDIDTVILSHLHFDHAGGLLSTYEEGEPRLLFPKAKFYVSHDHWNRAKHPHIRDKMSFIPFLPALLEASERLILVENEAHPDLDFGLSFSFSQGHTIGLMISHLKMPSGQTISFVSDLIPGIPWLHLPVTMGYDRYPELVVDEKITLLKTIHDQQGLLFFTHDPTNACVLLKCDSQGKYFGEAIILDKF